ncbi:MAG: hypothetical protein HOP32_05980 [Nitrospira sp.]|nr:hypothetical protein [Nitrospira sp.]
MKMNRSRSKYSMIPLAGILIVVLATETWGGLLEFEEVDTLPQVENILFTASHVGIVSHDGRLFSLDRQTQDVQQLDSRTFTQQFPEPWPPKPYEMRQTGPQILRSSTGHEFELTPAYCSEGAHDGHELRYQQRPFPDVLKHCTSVAALEIIGTQVWLGTVHPYEGGTGGAEGIVVQALDKKQKVSSITAKSGLTTDGPIYMLRDDPFTKTVWVATERGLNQVDRQFQVVWGRYWYEDFEPSSGSSRTQLIETQKRSNAFAVLGRKLGVQDWQAYRQVVQQIPSHLGTWGDFKDFQWVLYFTHMSGVPGEYFKHLNGLLPFVMEAAQSEVPKVHFFGLVNVCKFDDPRVLTFMTTLASKSDATSPDDYWIRECLKTWEARKP